MLVGWALKNVIGPFPRSYTKNKFPSSINYRNKMESGAYLSCKNCVSEELMEDLLLEVFSVRTKHEQIPFKPPDFCLFLFSISAGVISVLISVV